MGRELKRDDQAAAVKRSFNAVLCGGLRSARYCSVLKHPLGPSNGIRSATSQSLYVLQDSVKWPDVTIQQTKEEQITSESHKFNMTQHRALTFTDQAIHWPAVASHHHLPPRGLRCPSCPSYWLRWCVFEGPRHRSLHQTAPDPPGRAAPGWAPPEALGSHSSYLGGAERDRKEWKN